jgi:hypothetical protein
MCPLGEDCPGFVGPRWPTTNIATTRPLGHNCFFAHTYLELKFKREEFIKEKILKRMHEDLDYGDEDELKKDPWKPACAKIVDCVGCGKEVGKPG